MSSSAELIGASSGIGHMITDSQALLATDLLFKWANRRLYPWAQLGR